MKFQTSLAPKGPHETTSIVKHADGTPDGLGLRNTHFRDKEEFDRTVVTGKFPQGHLDPGVLVETIRDPENPSRSAFLHWKSGKATILHEIRHGGRILVPPDLTSNSFPDLSLPNRLLACGGPAELLAEVSATIARFVKLQPDQLRIIAAFVLASWFSDCFEAAPYLFIVGPLGSGKTKLLKVLRCLCRRGLIVADIGSGSLYKLIDDWNPTMIIDELELGNSGESAALLRLLRTGSVPGVPTVRNGIRFSTYGLKVISSRQPFGDAALASRGLTISMLPTQAETPLLDEFAMQELENKFQPQLCMLRLNNYTAVRNYRASATDLHGLSPRLKQIAQALIAPLLGDVESTSSLLENLREREEEAFIERSLEPEWLVAEALFAVCHEETEEGATASEILVGGLSTQINKRLETRGEDIRIGAKKAGLVLKSLGIRTVPLGRLGRGLQFTSVLKRKIHEIAAQLGIDRRAITPLTGLESGYGGAPCALCEKFAVTGGLRFVQIRRSPPRKLPSSERGTGFDVRSDNENPTLGGEMDDNK